MRITDRDQQKRKAVAMTWLLLLALGLRALLAPGIMPSFAHGALPITICTPAGTRTLSGAADGGNGDQAAHDHGPCLFAASGLVTLGAVEPPLLSPPMRWMAVQLAANRLASVAVPYWPAAAPRGPPVGDAKADWHPGRTARP